MEFVKAFLRRNTIMIPRSRFAQPSRSPPKLALQSDAGVLLLWSAAGRNEKGSDLNVGHLPALPSWRRVALLF